MPDNEFFEMPKGMSWNSCVEYAEREGYDKFKWNNHYYKLSDGYWRLTGKPLMNYHNCVA